jgi:hypothetical protein
MPFGSARSLFAVYTVGTGTPSQYAAVRGFFGWDVLVSSIVLVIFVTVEGRRLRMRTYWLSIVALLLVGVSVALPFFLYLRELEMEQTVT